MRFPGYWRFEIRYQGKWAGMGWDGMGWDGRDYLACLPVGIDVL